MSRGGKREGAGRPNGSKSELTKQREAVAAGALVSGLTPLEYMLERMRDPKERPQMRFLCAKEAAHYVHPKLSSIEHNGPVGSGDFSHLSDEEFEREWNVNKEAVALIERARRSPKPKVKVKTSAKPERG